MKRLKGFTLIEMIITITVIIILSAISVPIYKNYQQDAIMAEGYVLLGAIREAQKQYYSEWGNFLLASHVSQSAVWTNNEEVLGIDARGNKYFTWFDIANDQYGRGKQKYYFGALLQKPKELIRNGEHLILQYNITLGQRFIEGGANSGEDWM